MALSAKTPPALLRIEDFPEFVTAFKGFALANECGAELKTPPAASDTDGVLRDSKLKGFLSLAVQEHSLRQGVLDAASTKDALSFLESRYKVNNSVYLNRLDEQWSSLKQQPQESVSAYIDRVCLLTERMKAAGHTMEKKVIGTKILSGLPDELAPSKQNLITQPTIVEDVEALRLNLMAAESMMPKQPSAFYGNQGGNKGKGGSSGGGSGGTKGGKKKRKGVRCYNCGEHGHYARDCKEPPKPRPDKVTAAPKAAVEPVFSFITEEPPQQQEQPQQAATQQERSATSTECFLSGRMKYVPSHAWAAYDEALANMKARCFEFVVDSGATRHTISDVSLLHNVRKPDISSMGLGNGSSEVVAQGEVYAELSCGDSWVPVELKDVVCVPEVTRNLLSLPRIAAAGGSGVFEKGICALKGPGGDVLGVGEVSPSGHYVLQCKAQVALPTSSYVADPKAEALLWHRRMAHLGWEACAKLPELCEGVNVTPAEFRKAAADDCDICIQSKLVRAPFPSSERSTRNPLERVHCDLLDAGNRLADVVGYRYGLTVLDEHTGLTIVHVLRSKDEAWGKLKEAVAWLERQCGNKVKALRVDRGGEFVSQESLQWLRQKGIMFEPTAPHSPQQNGMAERLNRVFVERVRAMLTDSGLPHKYWFFAFQYANEVRNRSIYAPLGITPYEAFFSRKPDVSRLRVWGCQVYYLVLPKEARGDKFSPVSQRGWFMGLDGGGYRVLTTSGSTVVAHTVKCLERTVTGDAGDDSGSSGSAAASGSTG